MKFYQHLAATLIWMSAGIAAVQGAQAAAAEGTKNQIPRAASTPNTPKNWIGPSKRIYAQSIVDDLIASHPEVMSITMHGTPPGQSGLYTMFAGTFPDRIGNESSAGDVITVLKAVTQIEPKWGTPDWQKKVSTVLPLKDSRGKFLPVAMVIAFKTSPDDKRVDTEFLPLGVKIRDGLNSKIPSFNALFEPAH